MSDKSFLKKLVSNLGPPQKKLVLWEAKCYPKGNNTDEDLPAKLIIYQYENESDGFYLIPLDKDGNDFSFVDSWHHSIAGAKQEARKLFSNKMTWKWEKVHNDPHELDQSSDY